MTEINLQKFNNIIDVSGEFTTDIYDANNNMKVNPFADMGAWHGYCNLKKENKELYGGFGGPFIVAEEFCSSLSRSISQIKLIDISGRQIDLKQAKNVQFNYYPGRLEQKYELQNLDLTLTLIFADSRTSLTEYEITNKTNEKIKLKIGFEGSIYNEITEKNRENSEKSESENLHQKMINTANGIKIQFENLKCDSAFYSTKETSFNINYSLPMQNVICENKYESYSDSYIDIKSNNSINIYVSHIYTFTEEEEKEELKNSKEYLNMGHELIESNELRWNQYLNKSVRNENKYTKVMIKSIETLVTNWRSKAGAILHDGITPSVAYRGFNGIWAWDSWKQAVAVSYFDGELAKNNIRAMFDYQISADDKIRPQDVGTIIDCVFYNKEKERGGYGENWNERNSKPPLSAWAVWEVYKNTSDIHFLEEMYPKLKMYHNWWYANRDCNQNGIAEYGAMVHTAHTNSDGAYDVNKILEAAAWESGMDNAVRFDIDGVCEVDSGIEVFENKNKAGETVGYSINQESVCLNSFLYAEKIYLMQMAKLLNCKFDFEKYKEEAQFVANYINENMFHKETGFYYDLQFDENGKKHLLAERGKATEGWIPLWAGLATKETAASVRNNMIDENKFNTFMPFPTASRDNPKYAPQEYWRGPVWLDQALFGIESLLNYGYRDDAISMAKKLFENAEGLMTQGTIRENYNPETGKGLHASNFSWSSSAFYIIYKKLFENM